MDLNITRTKQIMADQWQDSGERVSSLMDGALDDGEITRALDDLAAQPALSDTWDVYHLVGQAMRSSDESLRSHDPAFVARLRQQLDKETPKLIAASPLVMRVEGQKSLKASAANDPWWRRVAGVMSVALVGVLAWQGAAWMGSGQRADVMVAQQVGAPTPMPPSQTLVTADGASSLMIRDPQLDALLAAHRQVGGATALQMPSGFLRNATYSEDKR